MVEMASVTGIVGRRRRNPYQLRRRPTH